MRSRNPSKRVVSFWWKKHLPKSTTTRQEQEFAAQQDQKCEEIEKQTPSENISNTVKNLATSVLDFLAAKQSNSHYLEIKSLLRAYTNDDYVGTPQEEEFVTLIEKVFTLYSANNGLKLLKRSTTEPEKQYPDPLSLNNTQDQPSPQNKISLLRANNKKLQALTKEISPFMDSLPATCEEIQELLIKMFPESNDFKEIAAKLMEILFNRSLTEKPTIGGLTSPQKRI